jgi:hypothetical protein
VSENSTGRGAYGLRLNGIEAPTLLVPAGPDWPEWTIERRLGERAAAGTVGPDSASVPLLPAGCLEMSRANSSSVITMPRMPDDQALAHPYLAPVAALASVWLGRRAFHAGAFVHDGGGWVVLGETGSGKSSLLASLATRAVPVLADDLVVVDGDTVFAGPRCIDLRPATAHTLGVGASIGVVGGRERVRMRLPAVPVEVPLSGSIVLRWGAAPDITDVRAPERLQLLAGHRALTVPDPDPPTILDMVAPPMLALTRPRDIGALPRTAELLLGALR